MAYDDDRGVVVLFGGRSGPQVLNDTWEWDGREWTQMADIGPSPRSRHSLVYDGERKRSVLFGGNSAHGSELGDTWEWNGEDWTQIADQGPSVRSEHAMAFDSERKRTVLFGGQSGTAPPAGDTWEWDGEVWTQQQDTGPSPRHGHTMAYDSSRHRTVLFGGRSQTAPVGDTWEWNGSIWSQAADFGPNACVASAMAFNGHGVILYGGISSPAPDPAPEVFRNTWEWNGRHWTQRQDIGPGPRWLHGLAFDSKANRLVLFGGLSEFFPNAGSTEARGDTWESSDTGGESVPGVSLEDFSVSPARVRSGSVVTAEVTLSGPAPRGGVAVSLQSANADFATFPQSIPVAPNAKSGQVSFLAPSGILFDNGSVLTMKAVLGGVVRTADFRIDNS